MRAGGLAQSAHPVHNQISELGEALRARAERFERRVRVGAQLLREHT